MTCCYIQFHLQYGEVENADKARTNVRVIGKQKWRKLAGHQSQNVEGRLRLL